MSRTKYNLSDHVWVVMAYKSSPYLPECITSIQNQTLKSQIIICTSTDNEYIRQTAKSFNVPLYVSDYKPSISGDWNFALKNGAMRGILVTLAHQDDLYTSDYVENLLLNINKIPTPQIYFTNYGEIRNNAYIGNSKLLSIKRVLLYPMKKSNVLDTKKDKRKILKFGSPICCPSVSYCTNNLQQPLFSNNFKCNLDWECWEKLANEPGAFVYEKKIQMYHRIHQESETTTCIQNNTRQIEDFEMFNKFWPKGISKILNKIYGLSRSNNKL